MGIDRAEKVQADIDINEDAALSQTGWWMQKVAWISLFIIVAMVSLGLFGDGHLSLKFLDKQGFNLQYDQYFRYQTEKTIRISSRTETVKTVAVDQSLLNRFQVMQIVPVPTRSYIENDSRVYEFYGDRNFIVVFYLTPMEPGIAKGVVKVNNVSFDLKHLIYP